MSRAQPPSAKVFLSRFSKRRPRHETSQRESLSWLAAAHAQAEATRESLSSGERDAFEQRIKRVIDRCACGPNSIGSRGHAVPDVGSTDWGAAVIYDLSQNPHGAGTAARMRFYEAAVAEYFREEYAAENVAPRDLIHVTCTGYVAPGGAQRLVAERGWGESTRVTHAYHMGCYAAVPAVRLAMGCLLEATPTSHRNLLALGLAAARHDVRACLGRVRADTLILFGSRDPLAAITSQRELLADIPHAVLEVIPDSGHDVSLEQPELTAARILAFLARDEATVVPSPTSPRRSGGAP